MSAPFVLNLRTNFYQQGEGVEKMERAIETRTCGAFYVGKRKQGEALHTEGVWCAHDEGTVGRAMARRSA